jgi:hypothetical protein
MRAAASCMEARSGFQSYSAGSSSTVKWRMMGASLTMR